MTLAKPILPLVLMAGAAGLWAHFVWVDAMPVTLKTGETAKVRIGNGHDLAESESALNLAGLETFAIAPSGGRTDLKPEIAGKWVVAPYSVKEAGIHRFYMIQDRGVMSQTATGFQPGGRDKHPDAKRSMKIWRSAVAYARTSGVPVSRAKSLGLPIELVCEMKPGELELTALRNGKPAPGVEVTLAVAGKTEPDKVGKTDAAGKVTYKANPTANKALLFIAAVEEAMPKGSNYESNNLTAVLHLNW